MSSVSVMAARNKKSKVVGRYVFEKEKREERVRVGGEGEREPKT